MDYRKLLVYFKDGRVFEYAVANVIKAREHMGKIWEGGYRHVSENKLEHYGPHYLDKIVYVGDDVETNYPDKVRGT